MKDQTQGYIDIIEKQGEEQRSDQPKLNSYDPGELKFTAQVNGVEVKDGDYWLPDNNGNCSNCY